jgi:26S proteasome regulatory subunit N2
MPAGVLSLLDEPDPQLRVQALEILDTIVDDFWAEISDYIAKMYGIHTSPKTNIAELRLRISFWQFIGR